MEKLQPKLSTLYYYIKDGVIFKISSLNNGDACAKKGVTGSTGAINEIVVPSISVDDNPLYLTKFIIDGDLVENNTFYKHADCGEQDHITIADYYHNLCVEEIKKTIISRPTTTYEYFNKNKQLFGIPLWMFSGETSQNVEDVKQIDFTKEYFDKLKHDLVQELAYNAAVAKAKTFGYDVTTSMSDFDVIRNDARVVATFIATSTTQPTQIADDLSNFVEIEVDGVKLDEISGECMFDCADKEHIVKYTLYDPTYIQKNAFNGCSNLISVTIPNGVESIDETAFSFCDGLINVTLPDSLITIGEHAFSLCVSLSSITIPNGVEEIDDYAFLACYNLKNIEIPNSVTKIGWNAFTECSSLTSINIPSSVTNLGEDAFSRCSSLTSVTIESGVTSITSNLFNGCINLTNVEMPNSITSIENHAFHYCPSLRSITIPNSVTSIDYAAFSSCSGLTSIELPNSVRYIDDQVFTQCTALSSVTLGNSVEIIGNYAFQNCNNLVNIVSNNRTAPTIQNMTFQNVKQNGVLTVPQGSSGYDTWMQNGEFYLGFYNWTKTEQ